MAIRVSAPGLGRPRSGSRPARLLPSRHPHLRRHGPVRPARREPAGRQRRRGGGCWKRSSWVRNWSSPKTPWSRLPAPSCRPGWTGSRAKPGPPSPSRPASLLSFDYLKSRRPRLYRGWPGGIDVPIALGSRSTYTLGALGGLDGRNLQAGDELPVGIRASPVTEGRAVPRGSAPPARFAGRAPGDARPLLAPPHRGLGTKVLRRHLEGRAGGRVGSDTASAAAVRWSSSSASSPSGPARILPISSIAVIPTARSRCPAGRNPSSCTATPCPAAAISWSEPWCPPTWIPIRAVAAEHARSGSCPVDMEAALAARRDRQALLEKVSGGARLNRRGRPALHPFDGAETYATAAGAVQVGLEGASMRSSNPVPVTQSMIHHRTAPTPVPLRARTRRAGPPRRGRSRRVSRRPNGPLRT